MSTFTQQQNFNFDFLHVISLAYTDTIQYLSLSYKFKMDAFGPLLGQ